MLGPALKNAKGKAEQLEENGDLSATFGAEGEAAIFLSSIPKSLTKQWTSSAEYQTLFGAKGKRKGFVNELINLMDTKPGSDSREIGLLFSRESMEQVKCKNSLAEAELAKGFETYFSCWVNVMVDEIGEVIEQELKTHLAEAKRNVIDELGNFMSLAEAKASDVISSVEEDVEKAASQGCF